MSPEPSVSAVQAEAANPHTKELRDKAITDFDHYLVDYLKKRKVEALQADPEAFEKASQKNPGARLFDWAEVQITEEELEKLTDEQRNEILLEAVHFGMLSPYHPEREKAARLHEEQTQRERASTPGAVP